MSFTANPRANQPTNADAPREPTGAVASDSLAAESLNNKGSFAENPAHPLGVKGANSTLNTTDTSGATVLQSAETGTDREEQAAQSKGSDEKGPAGLKLESLDNDESSSGAGGVSQGQSQSQSQAQGSSAAAGASDFGATTGSGESTGPDSNIRSTGSDFSGPGSSSTSTAATSGGNAGSSGSGPAPGTGVRPQVDQAPNYAGNVTGATHSDNTYKPKGTNLDDADESGSIPKTKTFTGAIGTINDPGRLAEAKFEGQNNDPIGELSQAGEEGGRQRQQGQKAGDAGQFGVLESERA